MFFQLWLTRARGLNAAKFFHWPTCHRGGCVNIPDHGTRTSNMEHTQISYDGRRLYCVSYANDLTLVCVFWEQASPESAQMVPPLLYITLWGLCLHKQRIFHKKRWQNWQFVLEGCYSPTYNDNVLHIYCCFVRRWFLWEIKSCLWRCFRRGFVMGDRRFFFSNCIGK